MTKNCGHSFSAPVPLRKSFITTKTKDRATLLPVKWHGSRRAETHVSALHVYCKSHYFLGGAIVSFATFATRNLTTVLALILMASPVCGLRPVRALRSAFTSLPMPGIVNSPFFLVSLTA